MSSPNKGPTYQLGDQRMNHQLQTQVNIAPAPKLSFIAAQGHIVAA